MQEDIDMMLDEIMTQEGLDKLHAENAAREYVNNICQTRGTSMYQQMSQRTCQRPSIGNNLGQMQGKLSNRTRQGAIRTPMVHANIHSDTQAQ